MYDDEKGKILSCKNLSPYLVDVDPSVMILRSTNQISGLNEMLMGNQPRDDGNLILDESEYKELIKKDPNSKKFIKKFVGATELIKGEKDGAMD